MDDRKPSILYTHYTQDNDCIRIVLMGDTIAIEFQSVDALGNEIWVAVRPPHHPRQRAAWDAMTDYIMSIQ